MPAIVKKLRELAAGLLLTAVSLAVMFVIAEIVLRFLPVSTGLATTPVDSLHPTFHFEPNREFVYSRDWNLAYANRGRTNNFGWVNNRAYDSSATSPLLAVVGDSYVEAAIVPFDSTIHGRLATTVGARGRVYSFGVAGAALSQYLAEAAYARDVFRPTGMAIVIVGNDFDESLSRYRATSGHHQFRETPSGLVLARNDRPASLGRAVMRRSAVARYAVLNLRVQDALARVKAYFAKPATQTFVGNTSAEASAARLADSKRVVNTFLQSLPEYSGLAPQRVVFVVDAVRSAIYSPGDSVAIAASYFAIMRSYFVETARAAGFEVIDLQPVFAQHFAREAKRFEFPTDGHWNGMAHGVAATALEQSRVYRAVFAR
ncbi:MAG TPA: hypothetical protein VJR92_00655 [Gemmatimonadaceae bacterium]|nr:hypothetical protein [Gemmatimonadaceae bacterium]